MSPERTERVRSARQQARQALGRDLDADAAYDGLGAQKPAKVEPPPITWEPPDPDSMAVVSIAEAAAKLGLRRDEVELMIARGEIATVSMGLTDKPWVPLAEVERVKAKRAG